MKKIEKEEQLKKKLEQTMEEKMAADSKTVEGESAVVKAEEGNTVKEQEPEITPTGKTVIYRNYPVKTGDVAPIAVLAAMSGISAGVLTAVERWKRKKEN